MKFIDNWILRRADKLKKKKEEKEGAEYVARVKDLEEQRLSTRLLKDAIFAELDKLIAENEKQPCHIEVGDRAILNIYSLGRNCENGWDGGPSTLLSNLRSEIKGPVTMTITKIYTDKSLVDERVDRFFEKHAVSKNLTVHNAWYAYYKWVCNTYKDSTVWDKFGIYKTAHFEYDLSFKPKWGLNVNSFIKEGTPEFERTYQVWQNEIELDARKKELGKELERLNSERIKLNKECKVL